MSFFEVFDADPVFYIAINLSNQVRHSLDKDTLIWWDILFFQVPQSKVMTTIRESSRTAVKSNQWFLPNQTDKPFFE